MSRPITENIIEQSAIELLASLGWWYMHGFSIAPGGEQEERDSFDQIMQAI